MKSIRGFWTDENRNRWPKSCYLKEHAIERSKTLVNCYNCYNCTNCTNCTDCTDCTDCSDCTDCVGCSWGFQLTNCRYCRNCAGLSDCSAIDGPIVAKTPEPNKYQKALEDVKGLRASGSTVALMKNSSIAVLQELVDKYSEMEDSEDEE